MTTTINLLPWREWRRQRLQREFIVQLCLAAVFAAVVAFGWYQVVSSSVEGQKRRNEYISNQISKLDDQIAQIKKLKKRRSELVSRMKVIQKLQGDRPTIVYLFDRLAKTLPDGVHYSSVERDGKNFKISGISESNNRISRLMRNLEQSKWFSDPNLQNVSSNEDNNDDESAEQDSKNDFILTVSQANPRKDNNNEEDNGGSGGES